MRGEEVVEVVAIEASVEFLQRSISRWLLLAANRLQTDPSLGGRPTTSALSIQQRGELLGWTRPDPFGWTPTQGPRPGCIMIEDFPIKAAVKLDGPTPTLAN